VPINDKKFDICAKVQHGNNTGYWLVIQSIALALGWQSTVLAAWTPKSN